MFDFEKLFESRLQAKADLQDSEDVPIGNDGTWEYWKEFIFDPWVEKYAETYTMCVLVRQWSVFGLMGTQ